MPEPLILSSQTGSVRVLTLNRAQSLNSLNSTMLQTLLDALDQITGDASVRCVVLTGAGRAFCAGQDLADPLVAPDAAPKDLGVMIDRFYQPLVQRIRSMPTPVVAAVNGVAAGAGANIALNCDIVIAARGASFIQAFSKIGLAPDTGGTWLLPRLVGRANALGLTLLGDKFNAEDAHRMGLIWKCVDDASVLDEALAMAQRLAAMPTRALVATRRALDSAQAMSMEAALDAEKQLQRELGFAHDYNEGVAAFVAKRTPAFTDR